MKYQKWHIGTASEQDTALLKEAGYPSLLATVLAARGITTSEAAAEALEREMLSPFACLSSQSRGRQTPLEPCPTRTCFQRDIDRIIHSIFSSRSRRSVSPVTQSSHIPF